MTNTKDKFEYNLFKSLNGVLVLEEDLLSPSKLIKFKGEDVECLLKPVKINYERIMVSSNPEFVVKFIKAAELALKQIKGINSNGYLGEFKHIPVIDDLLNAIHTCLISRDSSEDEDMIVQRD
jgi:hypothetical protein